MPPCGVPLSGLSTFPSVSSTPAFSHFFINRVEGDYEEHPNTWLNYGYEDGNKWTVYTLDIYRGGIVIFSKRDNQDDLNPEFEKRMTGVSQESALELWKALASGNIETLMAEPWVPEK